MIILVENEDYALLVSDDDMTHKVVTYGTGLRPKVFKGETAWSDSARYVWDMFGRSVELDYDNSNR